MIREFMIYSVVSTALSVIDFVIACLCFQKGKRTGRTLGCIAVFAGVISLSYLFSITTENLRVTSIMSSICFVGIDFLLVYLLNFVILTVKMHRNRVCKALLYTIRSLTVVDTIMLFSNIVTGAVVGYELISPVGIVYRMKPLYVAHLVFTYLQVVVILGILIYKIAHTPAQYRMQYLLIIVSVFVVVLLNAIFLFPPTGSFFTRVDCSVFGYSVGVYMLFWTTFGYRRFNMLKALSMTIVDKINQGIVLFDYQDEMVMFNNCARKLLDGIRMEEQMPRAEFLAQCGLSDMPGDAYTIQYDREEGTPIRCEFRRLFDKHGRSTGSLFVFTNLTRDVDNVTGFEYGTNLMNYARKNQMSFALPTAVAVFDIIGLRGVNRTLGWDVGNARIRALGRTMRTHLPEGTAFFRGEEAQLIAVRFHTSERNFWRVSGKSLKTARARYFSVSVQLRIHRMETGISTRRLKRRTGICR